MLKQYQHTFQQISTHISTNINTDFIQYQHFRYCGAALELVLPAGVLASSVELAAQIQATKG
jgi:hypothetical protein